MSASLAPPRVHLAPSPSIEEFGLPVHRGPVCVVTGATGFIARSLIALLINKGFRVRGTVRSLQEEADKVRELHLLFPALECFQAELRQPESFIPAFHDAEYVFHTAFPLNQRVEHPQQQLVDAALHGTVSVIHSALSVETVKKIVITSSCAAARGKGPEAVVTEADWNDAATLDDNAFAVSKVKAERAAWEMVEKHNLHSPEQSVTLISILPSYVIGPPISALTESVSIKTVQSWFDSGALDAGVDEVDVNCVDVRDVAKAHLAAIERPMVSGRYIVSLPDVHSPLDIIAMLRKLYPNRKLPDKYSSTGRAVKVGRVDNSRAIRELGLTFTPLETSLRDMVDRMTELGMIKPE